MLSVASQRRRSPRTAASVGQVVFVAAAAATAAMLLVLTRDRFGWREVLEAILRLRWAFVGVVALGGIRFAVRALAWMLCVDPPDRLGFRQAIAAFLAGDALATIVPAGPLASEPTKALLVNRHLRLGQAASSIAVENLFYAISAGLMIAGGGVALLFSIDVTEEARKAVVVMVVGFGVAGVLLMAAAGMRFRPLALLIARCRSGGGHSPPVPAWLGRVLAVEDRVLGVAHTGRRGWAAIPALEASYHLIGVWEIWLTLVCVLPPDARPTFLDAFVLEAMNRLVTVVFKMVPLRVGVDEIGSGLAAEALALTQVAGVSLAVIRKGRILFWTGVGLGVLMTHGWSRRSSTPTHPSTRHVCSVNENSDATSTVAGHRR